MNKHPEISPMGGLTLLFVACLTIMVGCVILPGLPAIARQLGVEDAASWLVTTPSLGVVLFGVFAGQLIQKVGLYRALCGGLFAYGLLGAAGGLLTGPVAIFTDRLLLGGATAVVMASGTGLISAFYSGRKRLNMIARQGMSIELGGVIFLSLGGVLAGLAWFWPFALYLIAWLMLGMVWLFVPQPPEHADEGNSPNAPLDGAIKRVFFAAAGSMIAFFIGVIVLPYRLHDLGLNESQTGYFLSFVSLVAVGAAGAMPKVVRRVGEYNTLLTAFISYGLAHLLFSQTGSVPVMIVGGLLLGGGFGLSVPLVNHMTVEQSHPSVRGRNLAYLSIALFSGQFLSAFSELIPGSSQHVFLTAAAFAIVYGALLWSTHRRRRLVVEQG
ncbi:MFS transporter [Marinobacter bohaiensis]|uniref:MFS transporter n=1 Tax=Marinobacter bohaiensis TaxID=2201898 RepID=UPI00195503E1|nr:MFS transporter [Marinobacter bohaiensis]